jgi:tRNA1Val (adenine37-N6)-methyltransferase
VVITQGHLLGGRVSYSQPAIGFRSGIEPVLLAASIPARPGDHVLEAGTGAGAALLCLVVRVPGVLGVGVERDAALASLADTNLRNNVATGIQIVADCIETVTLPHLFDHAMANPPYHPQGGTASPLAQRETAKRGSHDLMAAWIESLSRCLRHRGSLTLIVPAGMVPACLAAMNDCRCPCTVLFPLWPKAGRKAKLVLLRGVKNARTPFSLMSGLVLHQSDGAFTASAQSILSDGNVLSLDGP